MALPDKEYLDQLLNKAEQFCSVDSETEPVAFLYRNKDRKYFQDIEDYHGGIMTKHMKDNGGDPRCPINGRLEGLFFGVTLFRGDLPTLSPFGNTRVLVKLEEVFDGDTNLYFADFYCMRGCIPHNVGLVAAKEGTEADQFCRARLIPLDLQRNIFLGKSEEDGFFTLKKRNVWVEIFFTEDMDIGDTELIHNIGSLGQGHSTENGIPKNVHCQTCNI